MAGKALRSAGRALSTLSKAPTLPAFDHAPRPYRGASPEAVLRQRQRFLNPVSLKWVAQSSVALVEVPLQVKRRCWRINSGRLAGNLGCVVPALFHYYKEPLLITEGKMQAFGGIVTVSVGHCHPKVVSAMHAQNEMLQHTTTIYLNEQIGQYAEELAARMPGDLKVAYFVNSGSEANDLALMMARLYTNNFDVICLRNCYHGMSPTTMGLTGQHTWKYPVPQGMGVHHALNPDPYRGKHGNDGPKYAEDVEDLIHSATPGCIAAFISESIQGVGGAVPLADGYLAHTYEHVRNAGGVCIADEVQTGFGRTGSGYWGFESHGVLPDIVTMAKGIGNGVPLAAVVTTPQIAATLQQRLHFNTYGGNPVVCAAGRAVLQVIDEEARQEHCRVVGGHMLSRLRSLQAKHEVLGDVRGHGLMLGCELVSDRRTKAPAKKETAYVMERMRSLGVLLGKGGLSGNVFRIKPPMCFSLADADFLCDAMDLSLSEL